MKQTYFLALALLGSSLAFAQGRDADELNWFAMSDDLEVYLALNIEDGKSLINFSMYENKRILTKQDTVHYSFYGQEDEFSVSYGDPVDLDGEYLSFTLTDEELVAIKISGLEYFAINQKHYYFEEDRSLINKVANNIF